MKSSLWVDNVFSFTSLSKLYYNLNLRSINIVFNTVPLHNRFLQPSQLSKEFLCRHLTKTRKTSRPLSYS